jgi:GT2 family glycosyltransferase
MNKINQPKVTIIIVAYNAEGMKNIFKQCIDSALNLKYDNYEVIVVNNGSTDKTREILGDYKKDLKIINLKQNVGFANANNIAYKKSKSEFVLLLNPDAIPEQDSLNELIKIGISDNKIGALGGIQVDYKKRNIVALGGLCDIYSNWIIPKDKVNIDEVKESYYSYIPASFLLVRRKSINDTLFPKEFFTFVEDVELCFRIWSRGYYVKLYPAVVCSHEFRTSTKIASKRNLFLNRMLSHSYAKNSALLLSVYRKLLPKTYVLKLLESILYQPIIEIIHFPRYLMHKNNYNFAGAYYPSITMTYLKYSIKELSTINDYGNYIPLSIKLKGSKKLLFNPSKIIFGPLIRVDYEKTIINKEDINRSTRKFIVVK